MAVCDWWEQERMRKGVCCLKVKIAGTLWDRAKKTREEMRKKRCLKKKWRVSVWEKGGFYWKGKEIPVHWTVSYMQCIWAKWGFFVIFFFPHHQKPETTNHCGSWVSLFPFSLFHFLKMVTWFCDQCVHLMWKDGFLFLVLLVIIVIGKILW